MKRIFISVLLVSLLTFGIVYASTPGKLIIWSSEKQTEVLQKLGAEFEAEYGVPVEVKQMNFGDIKTKFLTSAPSGEGPDIIVGAHDWVGELVTDGLLEPITYMSSADKDQFESVALKAFTYNGKLYGVPYAVEAVALIYNKALVPTPPKTMKELFTIAKKLTSGEQVGFMYDIANFYFSFPLLSAKGGYVFKDTPTGLDVHDIGLANEGAIAGGELLAEMREENIIPKGANYNIMDGLFKEGLLGMEINGPWARKDYRSAGINYGVAPIPTVEGGVPKPFVGVQGFMMNSKSENKMMAIEFLANFATSMKSELELYYGDPRIPARKDVLDEVKDKDPDLAGFGASAANGIPMPNVPEMGAVWGNMGDALNLIFNLKDTPEHALKTAVEKIKKAIEKK